MKAIVTGVTGQDGYYMVQRLLDDGFEVLGLTSDLVRAQEELRRFTRQRFQLSQFDYRVRGEFRQIMEQFAPDCIFNYAARATGLGMFEKPEEIIRLNGAFVVDILEALRQSPRRLLTAFCQASSSEMYGHVLEMPQSETTPFRPVSPYGAAKLFAHHLIGIYRETYGVRCCSAILYNHESVRRSTQFVTKKIARTAVEIKVGKTISLTLGSLDAKRDWGYAPEYVDAMYRMARADKLDDYVVATGHLSSVRELCEAAFSHLGLDYHDHVVVRADQKRPLESIDLLGNPAKIRDRLGWSAKKCAKDIMIELVEYELNQSRHTTV